jgi:hypothetical protein
VENFANRPALTTLGIVPSCEKSVPIAPETTLQNSKLIAYPPALHKLHSAFTGQLKEDRPVPCKTRNQPQLSAQLLGQFIDQPVQILIVLANIFDLLDRVQNRRMMFSAELPPDLRQRSLCHVLG